MGWTVSAVSLVVFGSAVLCAVVGFVALRNRPDPMAVPLAALMFAAMVWAIPHALSFGFTDLDRVLLLNQLLYPGAVAVPVLYFVLSLKYAGYDRWLSVPMYVGLSLVPVATVVMVWTNPSGLFWEPVAVERAAGASVLKTTSGPGHWVNLGYSYLLIFLAWGVLANVVINSGPVYRKQALLMLLGGVIPTGVNAMFNFGVGPVPPVNLTTSALVVSGTAFAVALFRYDLLNLSPAAYRSVPDLLGDGVLVFDGDGRLIESNGPAERILDTTLEMGTPADDLFDAPFETLDGTVVTTSGPAERSYDLRYSPLCDQKDDIVGHALVMREVTELREHQQRLSVTNRILRHNLRNELNIILGEAQRLQEMAAGEATADSLERLENAASRLDDVGEKARHIQSSLTIDEGSLLVVDIVATVESVVERYRAEYPEATLTLDTPERAFVLAAGNESVETVVRNVVENALEHNDQEQPTVDVSVAVEGETVAVRVADDGPGIPEQELDILRKGHETQLQHGSSLGLWLAYWLVSAMGGDLRFDDNEPRGAVVTIEFQEPQDAKPATGTKTVPEHAETD